MLRSTVTSEYIHITNLSSWTSKTMSGIEFYAWPKPTALKWTTNHNHTVKLHCLCTLCHHLVNDFYRMIYKPHHYLPYDETDYSTEFKHHPSSLELAASSEKGCHLCSILWTRVQAESSALDSLKLLETHIQGALMEGLNIVPYSYALRVFSTTSVDYAIIIHYPPKYHNLSRSGEHDSILRSYLKHKESTDIAWIKMHAVLCLCIPFAGAWGTQFLGIPHQNSMYLVSQQYAHSNTLCDCIWLYYIVYIHIESLGPVLVVFCGLGWMIWLNL